VWARNGPEIYYRNGDRIMVAAVMTGATFSATKPRFLFEAKTPPPDIEDNFEVTPNGDFLMIEAGESDTPPSRAGPAAGPGGASGRRPLRWARTYSSSACARLTASSNSATKDGAWAER
jgi:hypothetical protein